MSITIKNPKIESSFKNIAEHLGLDSERLAEKIIQDFVIEQEQKKADEIAKNVANAYKEYQEAKKKGLKLKDAWELLCEL